MTVRQPRYTKEEFARRGNEIYESQVRPQVEEGNQGRDCWPLTLKQGLLK
jgi:hypothetical protein